MNPCHVLGIGTSRPFATPTRLTDTKCVVMAVWRAPTTPRPSAAAGGGRFRFQNAVRQYKLLQGCLVVWPQTSRPRGTMPPQSCGPSCQLPIPSRRAGSRDHGPGQTRRRRTKRMQSGNGPDRDRTSTRDVCLLRSALEWSGGAARRQTGGCALHHLMRMWPRPPRAAVHLNRPHSAAASSERYRRCPSFASQGSRTPWCPVPVPPCQLGSRTGSSYQFAPTAHSQQARRTRLGALSPSKRRAAPPPSRESVLPRRKSSS